MKWHLRTWAADTAIAVLAVVVIAFAGWVLVRDPGVPGDDRATDSAEQTPASETEPADPDLSDEPATDAELDVLVFGDESVRGARSAGRWITELNGDTGVMVTNRSRPLSGFVTEGPRETCGLPTCPSLNQMLTQTTEGTTAPTPDVVIVSAGVYDADSIGARSLRTGVTRFYERLGEAYPDAQVIVLSPVVRTPPAPTTLDLAVAAVEASAAETGATYLDVGQPYLDAAGPRDADRIRAAGDVLRTAVDEALTDPTAG